MRIRSAVSICVALATTVLPAAPARAGWFVSRSINPGNWPMEMAVDPAAQRLYVANSTGGDVTVFDTITLARVATIGVGYGAHGVAFDATHRRLFVASSFSNRLSVIDTETNVLRTATTVPFPHGAGYDPVHNRVIVTSPSHDLITVLDAETLAVLGTIDSGGSSIAVDPNTGLAYVEDRPNLYVVDLVSIAIVGTIEGAGAFRPVIDPTRNRLYAIDVGPDMVYVVDLASRAVIDEISVTDYPNTVGVNPVTGLIYVGHGYGGIDVIDPTRKTIVGNTDGHAFDIVVDQSTNRAYVTDPNGYRLYELSEDLLPPASTIETPNLAILRSGYYTGDPIVGTVTDDRSGVSRVRVSFTGTGAFGVDARIHSCVQATCRWEARAPSLPGVYRVLVTATDRARNVEPAGPSIIVVYT